MPGKEYFSRRDLNMYLNGSIIMYKGEPYVVDVQETRRNDSKKITLKHISNKRIKPFEVDSDSSDISLTDFNLGFVNYQGTAYLVQRSPSRTQRDGLYPRALSIRSVTGGPRGRDIVFTSAMTRCLLGEYPSFRSCVNNMRESSALKSMAFDSDFCVARTDRYVLGIYYRMTQIGTVGIRGGMDVNFFDTPQFSFYAIRLNKLGVLNDG